MAKPQSEFRQGETSHFDEEWKHHKPRKRRRLRVVIPAYPSFNIYSRIARVTTALGPISVATSVHEVEG
jgi:hypothetical protein